MWVVSFVDISLLSIYYSLVVKQTSVSKQCNKSAAIFGSIFSMCIRVKGSIIPKQLVL